jgi:GH35 family endo-1,4-beta-xylanase
LCAPVFSAVAAVPTSYVAYHFAPAEDWQTRGEGNIGATSFKDGKWSIDFSKGARSVSIFPPDRCFLGNVGKLRLRARGSAAGHPVRITLRTHFTSFSKEVGEFSGSGEQEIVADGPPGPGWQCGGGENDGKLHGTVRVGEIRFEANGRKDRVELELTGLTVEGDAPADSLCVLTAKSRGAGFENEIRCLSAAPLAGKLSWVFRDWDGKQLGQGSRDVAVPAGAAPVASQLALPSIPARVNFVEAELKLEIPGQRALTAEPCWLRPVERRPDTELRPESSFGMGLYLGRYKAGEEMERAARAASEAGVKWTREGFYFAAIEHQKGTFDWKFHDDLVACARRNGISVYGQVSSWPAWSKAYTEEGVADFAAFLKALVGHYKNDVHCWEIWNEPNIFFWQGPKDLYATLLAKSYAAIKEADPSAKVLGLSTSGIDYNFIARMLAKQVPFDGITIHPYRGALDDAVFIRELKIVADLVKVPDGPARPVWITEMGWSTATHHNTVGPRFPNATLRDQATLLARAYLDALVSGVQPNTSWYDFRNDGDDPFYFEQQMGIMFHDFTPKPAYNAYATLSGVLKGMKPAGKLDVGEGTFAYRFTGGGATTIALWNPVSDARASVPVKASKATLVNTIGETQELEAAGSVTVELRKGAPVYVVSTGK